MGTVTERIEIDVDEYTTLTLIPQHEPAGSRVLPIIRSVSVTPGVIAPGEGIGIRESIAISCADTQWDIAGTDYESGTLWPKVRAIYGTLRGRRLRYTISVDGAEETRHYLIDSLSVRADGANITARDDLWTLTSSIARAPDPSPGRTLAPVLAEDVGFTLTPAGVGDAFYRTSGAAVIGGRECVEYTRSGDVITFTARALHGTISPDQHEADSSFQEILEFNMGGAHDVSLSDFNAAGLEVPAGFTWHGGRPAEILAYLLVKYANTDPSVIPLASWYAELDRNYSARIAQPTGVGVLIGELIQQAGLVLWTDTVLNRINMRALINVAGEAPLGPDRYFAYDCRDQPEKQVTELWAWWGQVDPTQRVDEKKNYRAIQLRTSGQLYPELAGDDPDRHIREIFCRWIHTQANAEWLGSMMVARYASPPRSFTLRLHRSDPEPAPSMAQRIALSHHSLQNTLGEEQPVLAQVVGIRPTWDELHYELEELDLRALQTDQTFDRVVYLIHGATNVNLRTLHDIQYADPEPGQHILFIVEAGATIGGNQLGVPSITDGTWPDGVTRTLWIQPGGKVWGRGGNGQHAYAEGSSAEPGGDALLVTQPGLTVRNQGQIAGGGGGSASVLVGPVIFGSLIPLVDQCKPGGGGAGYVAGADGGTNGPPAHAPGGGLGQAGAPGVGRAQSEPRAPISVPGGAAGRCVVGYGFVTWETEGDLVGPIVP